jgi:hypothetical protein
MKCNELLTWKCRHLLANAAEAFLLALPPDLKELRLEMLLEVAWVAAL